VRQLKTKIDLLNRFNLFSLVFSFVYKAVPDATNCDMRSDHTEEKER